jgi:hypothetical protein
MSDEVEKVEFACINRHQCEGHSCGRHDPHEHCGGCDAEWECPHSDIKVHCVPVDQPAMLNIGNLVVPCGSISLLN